MAKTAETLESLSEAYSFLNFYKIIHREILFHFEYKYVAAAQFDHFLTISPEPFVGFYGFFLARRMKFSTLILQ